MKYRVQEILLVLVITVISVTAAFFIAYGVQSEPLHLKDTLGHFSKSHTIIHNIDTGDVGVIDDELNERL